MNKLWARDVRTRTCSFNSSDFTHFGPYLLTYLICCLKIGYYHVVRVRTRLLFGSTRLFMVNQNVPRVNGHRSCAHSLHQYCLQNFQTQTCIKEVKFIMYKSYKAFWPISLFIVIKYSYIVVEFWYFSIYLSLCLARDRLLSLSLCLFLNLNALANPQRIGLVFAIWKKTDPNWT